MYQSTSHIGISISQVKGRDKQKTASSKVKQADGSWGFLTFGIPEPVVAAFQRAAPRLRSALAAGGGVTPADNKHQGADGGLGERQRARGRRPRRAPARARRRRGPPVAVGRVPGTKSDTAAGGGVTALNREAGREDDGGGRRWTGGEETDAPEPGAFENRQGWVLEIPGHDLNPLPRLTGAQPVAGRPSGGSSSLRLDCNQLRITYDQRWSKP